jgi:hypothetical protein
LRTIGRLGLAGLLLAGAAICGAQAEPLSREEAGERIAACRAAEFGALVFDDGDGFETLAAAPGAGTLCVDGGVTDAFADWYRSRARDFPILVMRSLGGRGRAGIVAGEAAYAAQVQLVVWDYCLSACANGPGMGAARVIVPEPAILAWHGTLPRDRFEAVLLARSPDPDLRAAQADLLARHHATGERVVEDEVWAQLQETDRRLFEERAQWRERAAAILEKRGVHPDFLAASGFAARHAPQQAQDLSLRRAGSLDPILWVPGPEQLRRWGLSHVDTWRPQSCDALYQLGLSMTPAMVLTDVQLTPGAFYAPLSERD